MDDFGAVDTSDTDALRWGCEVSLGWDGMGWERGGEGSYKLPRRKTPARRILRSLEICSFQIKGIGRAKVKKSVVTFNAASTTAGGVNWMQVLGISKSQNACTGRHWKMTTRIPATV